MASIDPGFNHRIVLVHEIIPEKGIAMCSMGEQPLLQQVNLSPRRSLVPRVGEVWLIDRTYGFWSFVALWSSSRAHYSPIETVAELPDASSVPPGTQVLLLADKVISDDKVYICIRVAGVPTWKQLL